MEIGAQVTVIMIEPPNRALQRTRRECRGCYRRVPLTVLRHFGRQPTPHAVTEEDYITKLMARWPRREDSDEVLLATIALADEAVRSFPQSPQLWCIRGDLIQLGPESCPHSLDDALACYWRATEIAPQFVVAWVSLGHFHSAVLDDEAAAQRCFSEATRLRGHHAA